MKLHKKPVMPLGFKCGSKNCGIKDIGNDLSIFISDIPANAAGVFTKNLFPGAPVILGREIIKYGQLHAIIVNSKVSNVGTGKSGIEHAQRMADAVAVEFGYSSNQVIMSSTGVIAKPLPVELIEKGIKGIGSILTDNPLIGAEGIMTTDTYPKAISLSAGESTITIVGKGSGMIEPNMATMLVYIFTDADIDSKTLDKLLRIAVNDSFNMLSVDTDTSTSDTCIIMANGKKGKVDNEVFTNALKFGCIEMTKLLARDGEGATKLLTTEVQNASSDIEARLIAKALVNSPLIKTMAYGADPNIGRVLMAIGKCFNADIKPNKIEVSINDSLVYKKLTRIDFDENKVRKLLSGELVHILVNINIGNSNAIAYGCDLTEGYIKENAAYYSS